MLGAMTNLGEDVLFLGGLSRSSSGDATLLDRFAGSSGVSSVVFDGDSTCSSRSSSCCFLGEVFLGFRLGSLLSVNIHASSESLPFMVYLSGPLGSSSSLADERSNKSGGAADKRAGMNLDLSVTRRNRCLKVL